jgi:virginiamycin B lyase
MAYAYRWSGLRARPGRCGRGLICLVVALTMVGVCAGSAWATSAPAYAQPDTLSCKAATAANRVAPPPPIWALPGGRSPTAAQVAYANSLKPLCPHGQVPAFKAPRGVSIKDLPAASALQGARPLSLSPSLDSIFPSSYEGECENSNKEKYYSEGKPYCYWHVVNTVDKSAIGMEYETDISEPTVSSFPGAHSIDQLWVSGGGLEYTFEVGFTVSPSQFAGNVQPHFFIFVNPDDYGKESKYDTDFTPAEGNTVSPGEVFQPSTTPFRIGVRYYDGAWWFFAGTRWQGYVPGSYWGYHFTQATNEENGGEVADSAADPTSQMGDGQYGRSTTATFMDAPIVLISEYLEEPTSGQEHLHATNESLYSLGAKDVGGPGEWHFGGPGADPAPLVTTGGYSLVPTRSAELSGSVDPNNLDTHYYFEYGETISYGATSSTQLAGSGVEPVPATATIGGLDAGTTYHYRLVAYNADGYSYGSDHTFTTPPEPPSVSLESPGNVSARSVNLRGSVNPNGGVTHYYFEYGTGPSYGLRTAEVETQSGNSAVPVSATLSGLQPATTYYYRLVASNAGGSSSQADADALVPETAEAGPASVVTSTGELLVFSRNAAGQLVEFARANGVWHAHNVSEAAGTSAPFVGTPSALVTAAGELWVFVEGTAGELAAFKLEGGRWHHTNVSEESNGDPHFCGMPHGIVTPAGELLVFARGCDGELTEFAHKSSSEWRVVALSGYIGGPAFDEEPRPIVTPEGKLAVFVQSTGGELLEFLRETTSGEWGEWHVVNISKESNGDPTFESTPSPVITSADKLAVFVHGIDGEMAGFLQESATAWRATDISGLSNGDPTFAGRIPDPIVTAAGELIIFARGYEPVIAVFEPTSGEAWHASLINTNDPGQGTASLMSAIEPTGSELLLFAETSDGQLLDFRRESSQTQTWNAWNMNPLLEGETVTTPPEPPENTAVPTISPTAPDQAVVETATTGSWTNSPTSYSYQWELCSGGGTECTNIASATSSSYTPAEEDVEHTLVVKVTAANSGGPTTAMSHPTREVTKTGTLKEYSVQTQGGKASAIAAAPDGEAALWFTEAAKDKIGKIATAGEIVDEYALSTKAAKPEGITAGPNDTVWFTEHAVGKIGKITSTGAITEYSIPEEGSEPEGITAGPDGESSMWFADYGNGKIGRVTLAGEVTEYALPTEGAKPEQIVAGPNGEASLWFTDYAKGKIGKITTAGVATEYPLLTKDGKPVGITSGPDGNLWFADYTEGKIGEITTGGDVRAEYEVPTKTAKPEGITAGPDGNLWFTEYGTSEIGRITTTGTITEYVLPEGSKPEGIAAGANDSLWFSEYGTSKVAEVVP